MSKIRAHGRRDGCRDRVYPKWRGVRCGGGDGRFELSVVHNLCSPEKLLYDQNGVDM